MALRPDKGQRIHPDDPRKQGNRLYVDPNLLQRAVELVIYGEGLYSDERHSRDLTSELPTQAVALYHTLQKILLDAHIVQAVIDSETVDKIIWELSGLANHQRGNATVVGNTAELTKLLYHLGRVDDNELRQKLNEAFQAFKAQKLEARIALKSRIIDQVTAQLSNSGIFPTPDQIEKLGEVLTPYVCLHLSSDTFPKSTIGRKTNHRTVLKQLQLLAADNPVLQSQLVAVVSELVTEFNRNFGL